MAVILKRSLQLSLLLKDSNRHFVLMSNSLYDAIVKAIKTKLSVGTLRKITVEYLQPLVEEVARAEEEYWRQRGTKLDTNPGLTLIAGKKVELSPSVESISPSLGVVEVKIYFPLFGSGMCIGLVLAAVVADLGLSKPKVKKGGYHVYRIMPFSHGDQSLSMQVMVNGDDSPVWIDFNDQRPPNWSNRWCQNGGYITKAEAEEGELPSVW